MLWTCAKAASAGQGDVEEAPELGLLQDDCAVGDEAVQHRPFVVSAEIRADPEIRVAPKKKLRAACVLKRCDR